MVTRIAYSILDCALLFALVLCLPKPAFAYVDPGSGLLVCQSIGTMFAGILFHFRKRIRMAIRSSAAQRDRR